MEVGGTPETTPPLMRYAKAAAPAEAVAPYLPANYKVEADESSSGSIISGYDSAGWTLDDYVIPRLASGLIFAEECAG